MCREITCTNCKRPSWAGCGAHVEQVLASVPKADRCTCTAADRTTTKASSAKAGWFQRLLGGANRR